MNIRPLNLNIHWNKNIAMKTDGIKLKHFCCRHLVEACHYDYLSEQLITKTEYCIVIFWIEVSLCNDTAVSTAF